MTNRDDMHIQEIWVQRPREEDSIHSEVVEEECYPVRYGQLQGFVTDFAAALDEVQGFTIVAFDNDGILHSLADVVIDTPAEKYFERSHLEQFVSFEQATALLGVVEAYREKMVYVHQDVIWLVAAVRKFSPARPGIDPCNLGSLVEDMKQIGVEVGSFETLPGSVSFAFGLLGSGIVGEAGFWELRTSFDVSFPRGSWGYFWDGHHDRGFQMRQVANQIAVVLDLSRPYPDVPSPSSIKERRVRRLKRDEFGPDCVRYMYGEIVGAEFYH